MTVSSTTSKVSYSGNGVTTVFAVPFYFLSNSHLSVVRRSSTGIETLLSLNTDYTVTGAGVLTGGSVTMISVPASGQTITIFRNVPATQETDFLPNDKLPAESLEQTVDKLTMLAQEVSEEVGRALKAPVSEFPAVDMTIPSSSSRANKYLVFDGNGLPNVTATSPGGDASGINFLQNGSGATSRTVQSKLRDVVSVADFGAVGDGVTDDYNAFFRAINANSSDAAIRVFVPPGKTYKISKTLYLTRPVYLYSCGDMEDPGTVLNFSGATIEGNATWKAAIWVVHSSSLVGPDALTLPPGQVGTYGAGAIIQGLRIRNSSEHGIIVNAPAEIVNVLSTNNTKHGIVIAANTTGISGNANHTKLTRCKASVNGYSGFHFQGSDANTFTVDACMSGNNGWYGFWDGSLLGGVYMGCETQTNALAAYCQRGTSADNSGLGISPARTTYVGCYAEGDQPVLYSVNSRSLIVGSTGEEPEAGNNYIGAVIDSGIMSKTPLIVADDSTIAYNLSGGDYAKLSKGTLQIGWNGKTDNLLVRRVLDYVNYQTYAPFGPAFAVRITSDFNDTVKRGRLYIEKGFALSGNHSQIAASAAPTTGSYDRGNIVWNNAPSAGGYVGWVCVTSGTPGTWKEFGAIQP